MTAAADGRRLRSVRTREAVVDALLSLYDDGIVRPGAAQLAERAGVSQSSVFRLFQDLEDIVETAVEHQWTRLAPLFEAPPNDGDVAERVEALVAQRLRLYEAAGTAMRAGRLVVPDSPAVQAAFGARRALLRDQVAHQFAPELGRAPRARRRTLLDALDVASGLDQVAHLVEDRAFSTRHAGRVMSETLTALLREAP